MTKPGGRIAVIDFDHDMLAIDATDKATTRAIVSRRGDEFRNGWISRQLPRLFNQVGLQKPAVTLWPIIHTDLAVATALLGLEVNVQKLKEEGLIEEKTMQAWLRDLQERHDQGRFYACMVEFTVIGVR